MNVCTQWGNEVLFFSRTQGVGMRNVIRMPGQCMRQTVRGNVPGLSEHSPSLDNCFPYHNSSAPPSVFLSAMAPYSPHSCVHMVPVIGKFGYDPHTVRQLRYKTELCRDFQWGQFCPHGNKCWFAHGTHELRRRPVIVPAKKSSIASVILYKTQQCKKWREDGACRRSMM
jgi:hypothetical protein